MAALLVDSGFQLSDVTLDGRRLRQEYRDRDALLDEFRANLFHASTVVRDYLLASSSTSRADAEKEIEGVRRRDQQIIVEYLGLLLPPERGSIERLRNLEISYLDTLATAVRGPGRIDDPQGFLRTNVVPNRTELMHLIGEINALGHRDMDAGEERIQQLQSDFERRVALLSVLALLIAGLLAVIVIVRQRGLEREAVKNFSEVHAARHDLQLLSERLVAAQEEERRSISRELHDEIGQSVTAILMDLGRLESRLSGTVDYQAIVSSIRDAAEETLGRVRDLSLLLRPSMLDELGLIPAVRWQAREVTRRTGLKVKVVADDFDDELTDDLRTCIYRVVQEALHNCVKHARAGEARVFINLDDDALVVSVQDDGTGFDPKLSRGMGLLGIDERVTRLGGALCIESEVGQGTVLSIRLPAPPCTKTLAAGPAA